MFSDTFRHAEKPPKGTDVTPPSNKQTRKATETTARERAAALKAQAVREERRHKLVARGGVAVVVLIVIGVVVGIGMNSGSKTPKGSLLNVSAASAGTALPPWPVPADTDTQVAAAGLTLLPSETLDRHDHAHLDIWVDGKPTPVPAYIGIKGGAQSTGFASLHTHDTSGVIHIESPAGGRFTLAQVFAEWNVKLASNQIGGLVATADKTLTFYVNGKVLTSDPNKLELLAHQEIAIVYGTKAENATVKVPSSYKWTNGL